MTLVRKWPPRQDQAQLGARRCWDVLQRLADARGTDGPGREAELLASPCGAKHRQKGLRLPAWTVPLTRDCKKPNAFSRERKNVAARAAVSYDRRLLSCGARR